MSDHLPDEVITEILLRLPVTSLLRCRSVAKRWRSLIDSPSFTKLQIDHSATTTRNATLFVIAAYYDLLSKNYLNGIRPQTRINLRVPFDIDAPPYNGATGCILGSCNGLLCFDYDNSRVLITNPATRKWHLTRPLTGKNYKPLTAIPGMTGILRGGYGFGYDPRSDEYRVVWVNRTVVPGEEFVESEVLIFGVTSSSSKVVKIPYLVNAGENAVGVFVGGAINWVAFKRGDLDGREVIIGINLESNECKEIPQPEYATWNGFLQLGELRKSLCIIDNTRWKHVDVWVMKEYGVKESWSKLFTIPFQKMMPFDFVMRPLGFSRDGGSVLLQLDCERLVWYDLNKGSVKEVTVSGFLESGYLDATVCFGSLVPPRGKLNSAQVTTDKQQKTNKMKNITKKKNIKRDDFLSTGFKLKL
ncbi:F-box protein CPR1 [Linum grandiflorum]